MRFRQQSSNHWQEDEIRPRFQTSPKNKAIDLKKSLRFAWEVKSNSINRSDRIKEKQGIPALALWFWMFVDAKTIHEYFLEPRIAVSSQIRKIAYRKIAYHVETGAIFNSRFHFAKLSSNAWITSTSKAIAKIALLLTHVHLPACVDLQPLFNPMRARRPLCRFVRPFLPNSCTSQHWSVVILSLLSSTAACNFGSGIIKR